MLEILSDPELRLERGVRVDQPRVGNLGHARHGSTEEPLLAHLKGLFLGAPARLVPGRTREQVDQVLGEAARRVHRAGYRADDWMAVGAVNGRVDWKRQERHHVRAASIASYEWVDQERLGDLLRGREESLRSYDCDRVIFPGVLSSDIVQTSSRD